MSKDTTYISNSTPILIGGCGRSGTTLMRVMLDSHPEICCGPESDLFNSNVINLEEVPLEFWENLARKFDVDLDKILKLVSFSHSHGEFIDHFFTSYSTECGKKNWAEKTPRNVHMIEYIFQVFPKAKFIHMLRDGRDVVCSLRHHPRHKIIDGILVPTGIVNPIEKCLKRWVQDVSAGLKYRQDPRYIEVHYEDLVQDLETTTRKIFEFLEIEWSKNVFGFHEITTSSRDITKFPQNPEATEALNHAAIGRWKKDLTSSEIQFVERNDSGLLAMLGYRQ